MLSTLLGNVGSSVGSFFGGGMLSSAGRYLGNWIGDELENDYEERQFFRIGKYKDNLYPISSIEGRPIPLIYGKGRVDGQLIWARSIKEVPVETSSIRYFADHMNKSTKVDFLYYATFALGICEGQIDQIDRIWANNELINIADYNYRLYLGTEEQMPDPAMVSINGCPSPAYRGLAYIVFENFPLAEFGNNIPKFSFEVSRTIERASNLCALEDKILGVNIIPGSGEYVCDTIVQTKSHIEMGTNIRTSQINVNNNKKIPDSIFSLDYLQKICPKIQWVSPVVCWFADSLDIGSCSLYPAIENEYAENIIYSEEWKVANRTRANARVISRDPFQNPLYGGTINDASIVRYLQEIKSRGLRIMFYPLIFVDIQDKPWRGRISGNPQEVRNFFHKSDGYNNFILHYAKLCKGLVDGFVIGSELKALTSIRYGDRFPVVEELKNLAKKVRDILGADVKISYAADWSEYHHTEGGWYHLDDLWASDEIDFIGIDNYMPLTMTQNNSPTKEDIEKGFESGEGYDYYYENNQKIPLSRNYAWKNIRWFWENYHHNPDGTRTPWTPRSKKIWFTEFGFPSIDKATNQPNIFYDPRSVEGGSPYYSNSETNISIQRLALSCFLDYWGEQEYIENMILWCFDSRPYPTWPHQKKWSDHYLWAKGHWINGKIGGVLIADIIADISKRCGIRKELLEMNSLQENTSGIVLAKKITGFEAINLLRISYFFDIKDKPDGGASFVKRGYNEAIKIDSSDIIISKNIITTENESDDLKLGSLLLTYISSTKEYEPCREEVNLDHAKRNQKSLSLPNVMSESEASILAKMILEQIHSAKSIIYFTLPFKYRYLLPSDVIRFAFEGEVYEIRICALKREKWHISVIGSYEKKIDLFLPYFMQINYSKDSDDEGITQILAKNLEDFALNPDGKKFILFANFGNVKKPLRIGSSEDNMTKIIDISAGSAKYKVTNFKIRPINNYLEDEESFIEVDIGSSVALMPKLDEICIEKNAILINDQIIFFMNIKIEGTKAIISKFIYPKSVINIEIENGTEIIFLDKVSKLEVTSESSETLFFSSCKNGEKKITKIMF
ncbi:MAG: glycoside hydrolase TIM-barrel-like domain-containing protein [Rickettsiaceae bacterium]|nr:glycoside hydrolase TIM-barrel-like domain-containing protein [Rickettsiaceae bacterium]